MKLNEMEFDEDYIINRQIHKMHVPVKHYVLASIQTMHRCMASIWEVMGIWQGYCILEMALNKWVELDGL